MNSLIEASPCCAGSFAEQRNYKLCRCDRQYKGIYLVELLFQIFCSIGSAKPAKASRPLFFTCTPPPTAAATVS